MFDEVLETLLNEDTSGYPIPENLEYPGYTLETEVEEMLEEILQMAEGTYTKVFILDLLMDLRLGAASWSEMIAEMENFEG